MIFRLKQNLTILLILLVPFFGLPQNGDSTFTKKEIRKSRPVYVGVALGLGSSNLRDFATSPLIYKGVTKFMSLLYLRSDNKRETEFGLSYSSGNYKSNYNDHKAESSVATFWLYYSQLYQLNKASTEKFHLKIGGLFNTTGNLRMNPSLQNNAGGIEMFLTLFGSVKLTYDLYVKRAKKWKYQTIPENKKKPRKMSFAFRLNVGLMNNTFRNGYVYAGQSSILNEIKLFDGYQFKFFSGLRLSSALDYTFFMRNKNALRISYLWDAYRTGGDLDQFELAHHTIKFTILFNTNNK